MDEAGCSLLFLDLYVVARIHPAVATFSQEIKPNWRHEMILLMSMCLFILPHFDESVGKKR